jgi:hypothetical protein
LAFNGDTYIGLDALSLSEDDLVYAQDHLRILSGLYGLLRPLDLIQPYRLEMGSRLKNPEGADLYEFWGDDLAHAIDKIATTHKEPVVINLASNEYFKAARQKTMQMRVITPVFKEVKDGVAKVLGLFASNADPAFMMKMCFKMWKRFVEPIHFTLHTCFLQSDVKVEGEGALTSVATEDEVQQLQQQQDDKKLVRGTGCWSRILIGPNSGTRIGWDMAGAMLLGYDVITIPLSVFGPDRRGFMSSMEWVTLVFWTLDMIMSCISGVIIKGAPVMDPLIIMRKYLRTWFILDVVVVGPDWVFTLMEIFGGGGGDSGGAAESGKLLRALRIGRCVRLLRLAKLQKIMTMLRDQIDSELTFIVISIFKLLLMLLVLNHFLAAVWYGIGELGRGSGAKNWIDEAGFTDGSLAWRYTSSLHWSICMFSPGSMNVQPQNAGERVFAILVLLFGLVIFSSFISSITAAVAQLKNMQGSKSTDVWLLRRYLGQNGIKKTLSFRALRYIDYAFDLQRDNLSESKVKALGMLSEQLRKEVKYQVSFARLAVHPLLGHMEDAHSSTMHSLASAAFSERSLASQDALFTEGQAAKQFHMLLKGRITYTKAEETQTATEKEWLCEAAIWTSWSHRGTAHAATEVMLVSIEAKRFRDFIADSPILRSVSSYALRYVEWLSSIPRGCLTDVGCSEVTHAKIISILEVEHPEVWARYQDCDEPSAYPYSPMSKTSTRISPRKLGFGPWSQAASSPSSHNVHMASKQSKPKSSAYVYPV